jgi:hypothetical protein
MTGGCEEFYLHMSSGHRPLAARGGAGKRDAGLGSDGGRVGDDAYGHIAAAGCRRGRRQYGVEAGGMGG